jgi:hypothetical protein
MLIIMLIGIAVFFSVLNPIIQGYFETVREVFEFNVEEIISHPILTLKTFLNIFADYIEVNNSYVNIQLMNIGFLFIGIRFFLYLPMLSVNKIIYSKMTTNYDQGLLNAFISILPQSLIFALVSSVAFGIIDIGLIILLSYVSLQIIKLLGLIAMPISLALFIFVFSLRMTIFCQWLPEIASNDSKKVFTSLLQSFKPTFKKFKKNYICITVVNIVFVSLMLTSLIPTFGLFPILLIPTLMVFYISMYMALNFSYKNKKYFIDNGVTVYDPTKKF